jgi:hypothetical protein
MPPASFGYAHFSATPLYSFGGHLYHIPQTESEHTSFSVQVPEGDRILYPRGGHNYYGARDMERLQRRLRGILADITSAPVKKPTRRLSLHSNSIRSLRRKNSKKGSSQESSQSNSQSQGSSSQSGSQSQKQSQADSQVPPVILRNLRTTPEESDSPQDQETMFSEPISSEPEPVWIQRYLARETEEDEQWRKKIEATGTWSWLRGLMSPGNLGRN